MKKILPAAALLSILGIMLVPTITSAQVSAPECCSLKRSFTDIDKDCLKDKIVGPIGATTCTIGGKSDTSITQNTDRWALCCAFNTIYTVVDWVFTVLIAMAVIMVLLGAFSFLTSAGDAEKVNKGRDYIIYALIGAAVAFLAKAMPSIIKTVLGI